jgi:hypothetical protein
MAVPGVATLGLPRWRNESGRLEVWYATFTDATSNTGYWIHHELVAPPYGPAKFHGWAAVFAPERPAVLARFGPVPIADPAALRGGDAWVSGAGCSVSAAQLHGTAGTLAWDLQLSDDAPALYTFPRWAWRHQWLPAAQIVPLPTAQFSGTFTVAGQTVNLVKARGGLARIYGRGNALRWSWLHADLGRGDVLEIVAASSHKPLLRPLGLIPFVQLRRAGVDWPKDPLVAAMGFRAHIDKDSWRVEGRWRGRSLIVEVEIPEDSRVAVDYHDPDGGHAVCLNSERATARIRLQERGGARPEEWLLDRSAHAEIGSRP